MAKAPARRGRTIPATITAELDFTRGTKNTFRFDFDGEADDTGVTQLYVQRHAFSDPDREPTGVRITIEPIY